jgi:hypothetical protein
MVARQLTLPTEKLNGGAMPQKRKTAAVNALADSDFGESNP